MATAKHLVIIAGEESGDVHAATLVRQLLAWDKTLKITGIGGKHLHNAGATLISDLARFGITGLSDIIRYAWVIKKAFGMIKAHLATTKPDLLILVDYPGFNLRLAKFAKQQLGIRILYYISPQIWAWKANRINAIRAYVDRMAVILPFEKAIYQRAAVPVAFVGHPLMDKMPPYKSPQEIRNNLGLPLEQPLVALLPGSRNSEIKRHLPVMLKTVEALIKQDKNLHFAIPIAGTLDPNLVKSYFAKSKAAVSFIEGKAIEVMACSDCVVVASGTASLECALLEKPMCIIYKSSLLTYITASKLIKVNYLGLCNLLANKMIVPELLHYDCNAKELTRIILLLLNDQATRVSMLKHLHELKLSLSTNQADCTINELVKIELSDKKGNDKIMV